MKNDCIEQLKGAFLLFDLIFKFRTDLMLLRLNDLTLKDTFLKSNVRELENRLEIMENRQVKFVKLLKGFFF